MIAGMQPSHTVPHDPGNPLAGVLDLAREFQPAWEARPLAERLACVGRLRGLLVRHNGELTRIACAELGKAPQEVLSADIMVLAEACRYLQRHARRLLAPRRVSWRDTPWIMFRSRVWVERKARGVVGIIGTWNYPYFLAGSQMLQALVAGNTVIFKPSELAVQCSALMIDLFHQAGFPPEALQALPSRREYGAHLASAAVDHLVFTGSLPVGRLVAKAATENMVPCTLELSGCDALVALDDADPELVARAAWFGAVINRGQTCVATRRVVATAKMLEKVEPILARIIQGVEPFPLVQPAEGLKAHRLAVLAVGQGARFVGMPPSQPAEEGVCPPLVLAGARPDMDICRQALFAPVLCLVEARSEAELVAVESACPLSLGVSVFSLSTDKALQVAARLRGPNIGINEVVITAGHPATPIVARGASGWGSTQGDEGLLELTLPRVIYQAPAGAKTFRPHLDTVPVGGKPLQDLTGLLEALLRLAHGGTVAIRLGALVSLPAKAWQYWRAGRQPD